MEVKLDTHTYVPSFPTCSMTISMIVIMSDVYKSRWVLFGLQVVLSTIIIICAYVHIMLCHGSHRDIMCLYMMLVSTMLCGGEKHDIHKHWCFCWESEKLIHRKKSGIQLGFKPKNPSWIPDFFPWIYFSLCQQHEHVLLFTVNNIKPLNIHKHYCDEPEWAPHLWDCIAKTYV